MGIPYGDQLWLRIKKLPVRIAFWILSPMCPKTQKIDNSPGSSDIK